MPFLIIYAMCSYIGLVMDDMFWRNDKWMENKFDKGYHQNEHK
jgi:hypothetical protein